jgi:hypothetical protein
MPAPPIRLVALDIDGTLLRSDRTLSARTRAAVARARAGGVRVVLVTGRRHPSARRVADELGEPLPLVVHNGALVVDEGRIIRCRPLARDVAARAIEAGRARGAEPVVHCGSRGEGWLLVDARARPHGLVGYYLERAGGEVRRVEDVLEALALEEPIQVMFGGPREEMEELLHALAALLGRVARSSARCTQRRTRAHRRARSGRRRRKPRVPAGALGNRRGGDARDRDNWNARSLLEAAGRGLLMGNAPCELLQLGLPVLPTNDEDGVAQALETHVLG